MLHGSLISSICGKLPEERMKRVPAPTREALKAFRLLHSWEAFRMHACGTPLAMAATWEPRFVPLTQVGLAVWSPPGFVSD